MAAPKQRSLEDMAATIQKLNLLLNVTENYCEEFDSLTVIALLKDLTGDLEVALKIATLAEK